MSVTGGPRLRAATVALLAAVALVLPAVAAAQTLGQAAAPAFPWLRWFLAFVFCLLLAVAGAFALRARAQGGGRLAPMALPPTWASRLRLPSPGPRRLVVVEVVRASPTLEVCLIRCDGEEHLIAATAQGAVELAHRTRPAAAEAAP